MEKEKVIGFNIDTKLMRSQGEAFYLAYQRCIEFKQIDGNAQMLLCPAIVNLLLSCEILIKTLLYNDEKNYIKCHNLFALYSLLNDDIKDRISNMLPLYNCNDELKKISCGFEEWRYIYEQTENAINLDFTKNFVSCLLGLLQ